MSKLWGCLICTAIFLCAMGFLVYVFYFAPTPIATLNTPAVNSIVDAREWFAATSGWFAGFVAIFAAVLTIRKLSDQITKASEQHLEMMKFQAHEKLVLAKQVQNAASQAHGTIVQLKGTILNRDDELKDEQLVHFLQAAKFVCKQLIETRLSDKVYQFSGYRSGVGPFEAVLEEWMADVSSMIGTPERKDAEETGRQTLKRLSGPLVMLEMDLGRASQEAGDFIKRWAHLAA